MLLLSSCIHNIAKDSWLHVLANCRACMLQQDVENHKLASSSFRTEEGFSTLYECKLNLDSYISQHILTMVIYHL